VREMSTKITTPAADSRDAVETPGAAREGQPPKKGPATVVNGTRVTIAFPFSHLSVSDTPSEVRALADLVVELADALVTPPDAETVESLRERAHALRDALDVTSRS
jgi:hypothetical protein